MKIAVYHNLPSGGGKRALYEQVRRLALKHIVDVYTLSCAEHDFGDLRPFCRRHQVYPFKPGRLYRRPIGRLNQGVRTMDLLRLDRLQKHIAREIDEEKYDVVLVHSCQYTASPTLLSYLATPSVYYCHEPPRNLYEPPIPRPGDELTMVQRALNLFDPLPGLYRRTLRRMDRAGAQGASIVMVNSDYSRETFYRVYGIFARVVYLGVDTNLFRPLGLPRENYILSVGALNPRKGYDFIIRSLSLVPAESRPPLCIVCNFEGPGERVFLENLASRLGVSLTIKTMVSDEELVALYNRAALTVYAPVMEPFGFVPLESMACGTPVLGVREAGIRESVWDGVTGVLTERDPLAFANALMGLLQDRVFFDRLAKACRPYILERWTWEASIERLETILVQVANGSACSPSL